MVAGRRTIREGSQYNQYFDRSFLIGSDPIINSNGTNKDTLVHMETIVKKTLNQTKRIAAKLKGATVKQSLRNLWEFLYHNVQYKLDRSDREQLRTPSRTWKDRKSGVDCDCYSIFISSVLTNWGIQHAFRMAGYKADYQHVYVVVPKNGSLSLDTRSSYYTIDPVVDQFDYEVSFNKKFDREMKTQMLNGFGEASSCKANSKKYHYYERAAQFKDRGQIITREFLTENKIPFTVVDGDAGFGYAVMGHMVPPVISPTQAEALRAATLAPLKQDTSTTTPQTESKNTWVWWVLAGLGLVVLTTQEPPEKKSNAVNA